MKLFTCLVLMLAMLLTGCTKPAADTAEVVWDTLFRCDADTQNASSFAIGCEDGVYHQLDITDRHELRLTEYTPDGTRISDASYPLSDNAVNIASAYAGERAVYLIGCGYTDPYYLESYSREGALLASADLTSLRPELVSGSHPADVLIPYQYHLPMAETDDGIALLWGSYVLFLDDGFRVTGSVRLPSAKASLFDDGGVCAVYVENDIPKAASVTPDGIADIRELPGRFSSGRIIAVRGGTVYASDTAGIFRWSDGMGKEAEEICTFTPSGINGSKVHHISFLFRDGAELPEMQICTQTKDNNYQYFWMRKSGSTPADERILLTVATCQPDRELSQEIIDFNQSQTEYRALLIDYSKYSTAENPDGAWTKFRMDLETGILKPDVISSSPNHSRGLLGMEGYFTDLSALMAEYPDAGVAEEDIFRTVLTAYSHNGKFLAIPKSIRVFGLIGLAEYLPEEHWDLAGFLDYAESLPDGVYPADAMSRDTFDSLTGYFCYDSFVRAKNFNDPLYLRLLNYRKSLPQTAGSLIRTDTAYDPLIGEQVEIIPDPYSVYRDGTVRLASLTVSGPGAFPELLTQFGVTAWEDLYVIGHPTDTSGGLRASSQDNIFMIPEHCTGREGAWRFVAGTVRNYSESEIRYMRRGIGILKSSILAILDGMSVYETVDKAGNATGTELLSRADGDPARERADLNEAVRAGVLAVFDSDAYPELFLRTPYDLEEIIHEEEARFFSGQFSAEDTAKAVQSRTAIYIAEHE